MTKFTLGDIAGGVGESGGLAGLASKEAVQIGARLVHTTLHANNSHETG